jgi:hypothetical protein
MVDTWLAEQVSVKASVESLTDECSTISVRSIATALGRLVHSIHANLDRASDV